MITQEQIKKLTPLPFRPVLAYTRFRDQSIVPELSPYFTPPRFKRVWDGSKYTIKTDRGFYPIPKKKK